jgi:hypothetical protein
MIGNAQRIVSLGRLSGMLQVVPSEIEKAAEAAGIAPALTINGRKHYAEVHVEAIKVALKNMRR